MLESKHKATIVISYFRSCLFRERNLKLVLSLIKKADIPVVIIEQIKENRSPKTKVITEGKITHVCYFNELGFHKSKLYNMSVDYVDTEYVWFLDADVILPFEDIVSRINHQELIRPMGSVYLLDEEDSSKVLNNKSIDISDESACNYFGKHSFIIKKSSFVNCGMFDDRFVGWGWEDLDFVQDKANHIDPFVFEDLKGFHLFHPPAEKENERVNYNIYIENQQQRKQLSYCFAIPNGYVVNSGSLKSMLEENRQNEQSINFNFVFFGEDINVDWIDSSLIPDITSGYISIFRYKHAKEKNSMINACIYSSQGKIFSYLEDLNKVCDSNIISPKITNQIISRMRNGTIDFYSNEKSLIFAYNRSDFDFFGGFSENIKINNPCFKKPHIDTEIGYNNRDDLMYFDASRNDFFSV
tara:strand:+ start:7331 stop:8569 length:1239 start_codon:yes stop_codon:yes gene_type:complete